MQTLASAVTQSGVAGEPLPTVFRTLESAGFRPRRAQVLLVAGPPGAGKSALALAYVAAMNLPTLVFCADTDQFTTALRSLALITGQAMNEIEADMERSGRERYADLIAEKLPNLRFVFDPTPTLDDIDQEVKAFDEVWGAPPEVIVVDNLMNVLCDDGDEFRGLRVVMSALHHLSRVTRAAVFVLHHVSEEYDPTRPAPRKAIHGKVNQLPEAIWTVASDGFRLFVASVKNRSGKANANGTLQVPLFFDPARMYLADPIGAVA